MIKYFYIYVFFFVCNVFSQNTNEVVVSWNPSVVSKGSSYYDLPTDDKNIHFDNSLIYSSTLKSLEIDLKGYTSFNITDFKIESFDVSSLGSIDIDNVPQGINFKNTSSLSRNTIIHSFTFNPLFKKDSNLYRVTSFIVEKFNSNRFNKFFKTSVKSSNSSSSIFEEGEVFSFSLSKSGIYKIDVNFLKDLGLKVDNLDESKIHLYGHGGKTAPLLNSKDYPIDPPQVPLKFFGNGDAFFNDDDYFIFYAEGTDLYVDDNKSFVNPYADETFFYIKIDDSLPNRINESASNSNVVPDYEVDTYIHKKHYEEDLVNIGKMGRRWFGKQIYSNELNELSFSFENIVPGNNLSFEGDFAISSNLGDEGSTLTLEISDNYTNTANFIKHDEKKLFTTRKIKGENISITSPSVNFKFSVDTGSNPLANCYLDYLKLEVLSYLKYGNSPLYFNPNHISSLTNKVYQYNFSNSQNIFEVWNITDPNNISSYSNKLNSNSFSFSYQKTSFNDLFVAFSTNDFLTPNSIQNPLISNQNLKKEFSSYAKQQSTLVDYLLITHKDFLVQANRLAELNRLKNNLNCKVVTLQEIYNEFSSGKQDIAAIRNFVKYVYNSVDGEDKLKYLCVFGDASFDYKNRIKDNTNLFPIWSSFKSEDLKASYISDDFLVMMDANEGNIDLTSSGSSDIAVGRIIFNNSTQANTMIDKIEQTYSPKSFGRWRNNIMISADDIDSQKETWEANLQLVSDQMTTSIENANLNISSNKLYIDSFVQQITSAGQRYPEVNKSITNSFNYGASLFNYFGHGNINGMANELIFNLRDAKNLVNPYRYSCFVTITCELTKFDDPSVETTGEAVYLNDRGGANCLVTTTRQIGAKEGEKINIEFYNVLLKNKDLNTISIAEALRQAKNNVGVMYDKFMVSFIGDPALKLLTPKNRISLTSINDEPIDNLSLIKALSKVKLSGEVLNEQGQLNSSLNGTVNVTLYDKNIERETLANDGVIDSSSGNLIKMKFDTMGDVVFNGLAKIQDGKFSIDFRVPKDIDLKQGFGRVSFYGFPSDYSEDFSGGSRDILIGGFDENAPDDNINPEMTLFMNDESFVSGGVTNNSPNLIVKLFDENGINVSGGIGHDIIAVLDNEDSNSFVLNDYYEANLNDYKNGKVVFKFNDLEPGLHTLKVKAFDTYNNSVTQEIQFYVQDEADKLVISNVLNYPNPFINYTEFWFSHNSSEPLEVMIQIFTVSGKLVRTLRGVTSSGLYGSDSLSRDISWDGKDDFGQKLAKGVYIYKIKAKSTRFNKQAEKIEKLVIL